MKSYLECETLVRSQPSYWLSLRAVNRCVTEIMERQRIASYYPPHVGICWGHSIETIKGCAQVFLQDAAKYPPLPLP